MYDNSNITPEMRLFLEGLLESNGISFVDEQTREGMISQLYTRVDKFITLMIINELDDADNDKFAEMLEQDVPQGQVQDFLKHRIPDFESKVRGTLADFRAVYLGE